MGAPEDPPRRVPESAPGPGDGQPGRAARRAEPTQVARVLGGLASVGPYFAVDLAVDFAVDLAEDLAEDALPSPPAPFVSVRELYGPGGPLGDAIDALAGRLHTGERRVAASTLHLGYSARLWSIVFGCWARGGIVPDLPADRLGAAWVAGAPVRLVLSDAGGWQPSDPGDLDTVAALMFRTVVDGHLRPLLAAMLTDTRAEGLNPAILWGNAASALVGAVRVLLSDTAPDHDCRRLVRTLLDLSPLAGTARYLLAADGELDVDSFARRSCCLFYRLPHGGLCGDCPLR